MEQFVTSERTSDLNGQLQVAQRIPASELLSRWRHSSEGAWLGQPCRMFYGCLERRHNVQAIRDGGFGPAVRRDGMQAACHKSLQASDLRLPPYSFRDVQLVMRHGEGYNDLSRDSVGSLKYLRVGIPSWRRCLNDGDFPNNHGIKLYGWGKSKICHLLATVLAADVHIVEGTII